LIENKLTKKKKNLPALIGPGILVAATGVGAGDLSAGAFTGSKLGLAVLWAVIVGAGLKYVLNEGLARWQLVTGNTLLEGAVAHFGRPALWFFFGYLIFWSFFVAAVLMSACGVCAHAIFSIFPDAAHDKILYGLGHSALAVLLIELGGYRLFTKVMSACIAIMFVVVVATAVALTPSWSQVASGLVIPKIPQIAGEGLPWTIALMGGVGGTVTVLCYGYWIREEGRHGADQIRTCRIDLATGYIMTAFFGLAMVIIGNQTGALPGTGASLVANLADVLKDKLGSIGTLAKWAFLVGAWGAVFSSLLGVWQSVPYLFADFCQLMQQPRIPNYSPKRNIDASTKRDNDTSTKHHVDAWSKDQALAPVKGNVDTHALPYQLYLFALALIPAAGLTWINFEHMVKWYSIVGALFIPILALALLFMNSHSRWITRRYRNSWFTTALLIITLALFLWAGWFTIHSRLLA
jgi:Mn2+/Fe2+ NRAMP family transporter